MPLVLSKPKNSSSPRKPDWLVILCILLVVAFWACLLYGWFGYEGLGVE